MAILKNFCCGLPLRSGALIVVYCTLVREIFKVLAITSVRSGIAPTEVEALKNEPLTAEDYSQLWVVIFNIVVEIIALYAIYKERAILLIPFLAYRTVILFYSVLTMMNARSIANTLNESMENSLDNERDETFDTFPFVLLAIMVALVVELYFVLVVYSYYQVLLVKMTSVAVAIPVMSYTITPLQEPANLYAQPPMNPYIFESKASTNHQLYEPYFQPGVHYFNQQNFQNEYYRSSNNNNYNSNNSNTHNFSAPSPPPPPPPYKP